MVQDFVPAPRRYSKKSSRRVPPAAFLQLLHKIASACSASREVAAWSRWPDPPLQLSFAPIHPVLQTRSFLASLRGDSSTSTPKVEPHLRRPQGSPSATPGTRSDACRRGPT